MSLDMEEVTVHQSAGVLDNAARVPVDLPDPEQGGHEVVPVPSSYTLVSTCINSLLTLRLTCAARKPIT